MKKGSIAIIGSRGIPASYGGFETVVESIAPKLVEAGWTVFVSCEGNANPERPQSYKGVNLFYFPIRPFFRIAYETLYDVYSLIWASLRCDCIYIMGYGAALFFFIPKIFRKPLVVNVDGLEWQRAKFNRLEKTILGTSERAAMLFANKIVADSHEIRRYIEKRYDKEAVYITYGANTPPHEGWDKQKLARYPSIKDSSDLKAGDYWLVVARLEPENNIHVIIQAFLKAASSRNLLIVGNFSNRKYEKYITELLSKNSATEKVILPGAIYDAGLLNMLRQNCYAYIHGHSVGGTNPALLEAMGMRNLIIAHDNKFNREVGEQTLLYFREENDLAKKIADVDNDSASYAYLRDLAFSRVKLHYSWQDIVERYDSLFGEIVTKELKNK